MGGSLRTGVGAALVALGACTPAEQGSGRGVEAGPPASQLALPATPGAARADSLVTRWVADGRIPGAVLSVNRGGRPVFRRAYGAAEAYVYGEGQYGLWRTRGGGGDAAASPGPAAGPGTGPVGGIRAADGIREMSPSTVFDLASLTKVLGTTFAVMMLVDDGLLDLDAPVRTWLPDFSPPGPDGDPAAADGVTLRHLLTHRAGLRQWVPTYYHATTPDEAYAYIRTLPLGWPPGEGRHYSDLGFMLLGRIVAAVSRQRLDRFLAARLYGPLGLERVGFRPTAGPIDPLEGPFAATSHGNPFEYRMVHDSTFGYRIEGDPDAWDGWRRRTLVGEVNDGNAFHAFGGVAGHAGLFGSAPALDVLLQVLLAGGRGPDGVRLVSEPVVRSFLRPSADGDLLGWQAAPWAPPGSFTHTGFTGTFALGVPAEALSVVLLTNRQHRGVGPDDRYPDVGPLQRAVSLALLADVGTGGG